MKKLVFLTFVLIIASGIFVYLTIINNDSIQVQNHTDKTLAFSIERDIPLQVDSPEFCWFHPRVASVPKAGKNGNAAVIMTLQKHLEADDYYSGLYYMRTDDLGKTWRGPIEIPELAWRFEDADNEKITVSVADVTPGYHEKTDKVIAIGAQVRYTTAGVHYRDNPRSLQTDYAIYDPRKDKWSNWQLLEVTKDPMFDWAVNACSQWIIEPDGNLLVPIYFKIRHGKPQSGWGVVVVKYGFDGKKLKYIKQGNEVYNPNGDFYEPSLVKYKDKFYLTLRTAGANGCYSISSDGLNYSDAKPWMFDDGTPLGSLNTQQHWLVHSDGLFLCYTRTGANNDHIARARAPLFIAQVDTKTMNVMRKTEQILVPERGLMLGNFGANFVNEKESWVTDNEFIFYPAGIKPTPQGGNGSLWVAKVKWSKPNLLKN